MEIKDLINQCAEITQSKGFNVKQHDTQLLLIASEVAEAMECTRQAIAPFDEDLMFQAIKARFTEIMVSLETYRQKADNHVDNSFVRHYPDLLEELADILIRVFSYVGANNFTNDFLQALEAKIKKNGTRPYLHNKKF
jgi:NTP pyrophosphatase (non-canonical NTP hydrolase)